MGGGRVRGGVDTSSVLPFCARCTKQKRLCCSCDLARACLPARTESTRPQKIQENLRKISPCGLLRSKENANARPEAIASTNAISRHLAGMGSDFCRFESTGRPSMFVLCGRAWRSMSDPAQKHSSSNGWNASKSCTKQLTGANGDLHECQVLGLVAEKTNRT